MELAVERKNSKSIWIHIKGELKRIPKEMFFELSKGHSFSNFKKIEEYEYYFSEIVRKKIIDEISIFIFALDTINNKKFTNQLKEDIKELSNKKGENDEC